jgi:hypothetical protein
VEPGDLHDEPADEWSVDGGGASNVFDDAGSPVHYPPAPVPAHERVWRHPSEVGQAQWAMSEPPLVIGRGLLVVTGAISCVLGAAALWLMLPTHVPAPVAVETRSTGSVANFALPAERIPANTLALTVLAAQATSARPPAIAVMVTGMSSMLTTAAAVADKRRLVLRDDDGTKVEARVVSVERGVATLEAVGTASFDNLDVMQFDSTATVAQGEQVTVLGLSPRTVGFALGKVLTDSAASGITSIAEGTPVVNSEGALVALCTLARASDGTITGVQLVPVVNPAADVSADAVPNG